MAVKLVGFNHKVKWKEFEPKSSPTKPTEAANWREALMSSFQMAEAGNALLELPPLSLVMPTCNTYSNRRCFPGIAQLMQPPVTKGSKRFWATGESSSIWPSTLARRKGGLPLASRQKGSRGSRQKGHLRRM